MILITGGTGFIGRQLTEQLLLDGQQVRLLSRNPAEAKRHFPKADVAAGDILQPETLGPAVKGAETVIHLAGIVSYSRPREEILKINTQGTQNLVSACTAAGVSRFIFSSSVGVYGPSRHKIDEASLCHPMNAYGESKLLAERAILSAELPHVILRVAPVYGVDSPSWTKNLELLDKGFPVPGTKNLTHVIHVSDAVQAFKQAVAGGKGVYVIAGQAPVPFSDFALSLVRLLGRKPKTLPLWIVAMVARLKGMKPYLDVLTMHREYDISRAVSELGFSPDADFEQETKKMVQAYRNTHPAPLGG